MTAAVARGDGSVSKEHCLRPIEPRRDMADVAHLIEISFADELDTSSRRMVREMKAFGRAGWLGWLLGRLFLPPAAYPQGFVWQEQDELIGNASLLPVSPQSSRWVLANVAVHPDYRRRGIARQLVLACLDLAIRNEAEEVVLQVRHDNQGAIDLYHDLDFEILTTRTDWRLASGKRPRKRDERIRRAKSDEWWHLWQLAGRLFPEGVQWPYRLKRNWFEPSTLPDVLTPNRARRWVHLDEEAGRIDAGALARVSADSQAWQLIVLVPEPKRGQLDVKLIAHAVGELSSMGLPFSLSYPVGYIDDDLKSSGFQPGRTLTWMGLQF